MKSKLIALGIIFTLMSPFGCAAASAADAQLIPNVDFENVVEHLFTAKDNIERYTGNDQLKDWCIRNMPGSGSTTVKAVSMPDDAENNVLQMSTTAKNAEYPTLGAYLPDIITDGRAEISVQIGREIAPKWSYAKMQLVSAQESKYVDFGRVIDTVSLLTENSNQIMVLGEIVPNMSWTPNKLYDHVVVFDGAKKLLRAYLYDGNTLLYASGNHWTDWENAVKDRSTTKLGGVALINWTPANVENMTSYYDNLKAIAPSAFAVVSQPTTFAPNKGIELTYNTFVDADSLSNITATVTPTNGGDAISLQPSASGKKLILKPVSALEENASYTVCVSGAQSVFGDAADELTLDMTTGEAEPILTMNFENVVEHSFTASDNGTSYESSDDLNGWLIRGTNELGANDTLTVKSAAAPGDTSGNKVLQIDTNAAANWKFPSLNKAFPSPITNEKIEFSARIGVGADAPYQTKLQLVQNDANGYPVWNKPKDAIFMDHEKDRNTFTVLGETVSNMTWTANKMYDLVVLFDGTNQMLKAYLYDGDTLIYESSENRWNAYWNTNNAGSTTLGGVAFWEATKAGTTTAYCDDLKIIEPSAFAVVSHSEKIDSNGEIELIYNTFVDADSLSSANISVTSESGEEISVESGASGKKLILKPETVLKENSIYTINVSGVKSIFGNTAIAATKNVLTNLNIKIALSLNGSEDNKTLTDGNNTVTAVVTANDGTAKPVTLIAALYDCDTNALLAASADDGTASADGTELTLSASCDLTSFADCNCELKVLTWCGFDRPEPYGESTVFRKSN